jgi:hypothetical protein
VAIGCLGGLVDVVKAAASLSHSKEETPGVADLNIGRYKAQK